MDASRRARLAPWVAASVGVLLYLNTLGNGFVFDDIFIVQENPSIRSLRELPAVFTRNYWYPQDSWDRLYRPLTIASYSLVDKAGVERLHPMPYIALMGLGLSVVLCPIVLTDRRALRHEWRRRWRTILLASAMNLTSYLLVLFAFRLSKVGYVVASRELSILFSAFIGSLWLGEGRLAPRLAGASVVLAGVICVAFARD